MKFIGAYYGESSRNCITYFSFLVLFFCFYGCNVSYSTRSPIRVEELHRATEAKILGILSNEFSYQKLSKDKEIIENAEETGVYDNEYFDKIKPSMHMTSLTKDDELVNNSDEENSSPVLPEINSPPVCVGPDCSNGRFRQRTVIRARGKVLSAPMKEITVCPCDCEDCICNIEIEEYSSPVYNYKNSGCGYAVGYGSEKYSSKYSYFSSEKSSWRDRLKARKTNRSYGGSDGGFFSKLLFWRN